MTVISYTSMIECLSHSEHIENSEVDRSTEFLMLFVLPSLRLTTVQFSLKTSDIIHVQLKRCKCVT